MWMQGADSDGSTEERPRQIGDGDRGASPIPDKAGTVPGMVPDGRRRVPSSRTLMIV